MAHHKRIDARPFQGWLILLVAVVVICIVNNYYAKGLLRLGINLGCLIVAVGTVIFIIQSIQKQFRSLVLEEAVGLSSEYQQYMSQWEYPYALLSSNLRVVWQNEAFRKLVGYEDCKGKSLQDLGIEWSGEKPDWDPLTQLIDIQGRSYQALMNQIRLRDQEENLEAERYTQVFGLSMRDVSRERELERENFEQQSVVMLLYMDNYDQIIGTMDENQRPLFEANVYRTISDFSNNIGGIMTRLERDRFFVIFPRRSLEELEAQQFEILEEIKKIESGERYQTTLSIGVGVDADIEKARGNARMAVELAMGRGGDQAVVRTLDNSEFFGGASGSVEVNTRVRARLIAYALRDLIEASDKVLIMGHSNPDLDAFGSALGMYRASRELEKSAYIVMDPDNHSAVDYLYSRVMESKEYADVMVDHPKAIELVSEKTLLVVVDVNRKSFADFPELIDNVQNIAVIDHHRTAADSIAGAQVSYVEPFASSASEMVTELLQYIAERPALKTIEVDGLFSGIALDTKNFTVMSGVRTFEAAAYLRRRGADSIRVRKMFRNDFGDYKAKAAIVGGAEIIDDKIAVATWRSEDQSASTITAQAADELMDIHGMLASFVLTDIGGGQVNISARSLGDLNVQVIMEELGGGGHHSGAGAQLKDTTLEEAKERLIGIVKKRLPSGSGS